MGLGESPFPTKTGLNGAVVRSVSADPEARVWPASSERRIAFCRPVSASSRLPAVAGRVAFAERNTWEHRGAELLKIVTGAR